MSYRKQNQTDNMEGREMSGQITEQKIIVYVRGGVIEDVTKSPEDLEVIVEVRDYDIIEEANRTRTDENGESFGLTQY